MKIPSLFLALLIFCSCQNGKEKKAESAVPAEPKADMPAYPDLLQKALEAHGGLSTWHDFRQVSYDLKNTLGSAKEEQQLIDLDTRKVLITGTGFKLGMDGENVWVAPNKEAFGKTPPRFYHNLIFYFFSMPFVLADPGIKYEDLGEKIISGKSFRALKIAFNEGVGDADKDVYIALFNPQTHRLELLLYTVTYFNGEVQDKYNALEYTDWQTVNGLYVPQKMVGHVYENDSLGEVRYETMFSQVKFSKEAPDSVLFTMPEEAEIDSLKMN